MKIIHLDFKGKDSVPFSNDIEVSDEVYGLLQKLIANKKPGDQIFSNASAHTVRMFLDTALKGTTPKNLRTVKANQEFIDEAKNLLSTVTPKTEIEKIRIFYLANKKVAEKLNHQKNIGKNHGVQADKLKEKIKLSEQRTKEVLLKIKEAKLKLDIQEKEYQIALSSTPAVLKVKIEEIKLKRQKLVDRELRTQKALERAHFNLEKKEGTKEISLGTSLASYLDPRICISLCKEIELEPGRIYTKRQLETFDYALTTDKAFWRSL